MEEKRFNIVIVSYLMGMVYGVIPTGNVFYNLPLFAVTFALSLFISCKVSKNANDK